MERFKTESKYLINNISHSNEALSIISKPTSEEVLLTFMPQLYVNEAKKSLSSILTAYFVDENDHQITNRFLFRMDFLLKDENPIRLNDGKVDVSDFGVIVSLFDTTIGAFRGVFFEWLKDSPLQRPLPIVDLEDFLKNLNVSFSN